MNSASHIGMKLFLHLHGMNPLAAYMRIFLHSSYNESRLSPLDGSRSVTLAVSIIAINFRLSAFESKVVSSRPVWIGWFNY